VLDDACPEVERAGVDGEHPTPHKGLAVEVRSRNYRNGRIHTELGHNNP
jgi:hypothetical protein